jgi:hypothetical protein
MHDEYEPSASVEVEIDDFSIEEADDVPAALLQVFIDDGAASQHAESAGGQ